MRTIEFRAWVCPERHYDDPFGSGMHPWEDVRGWVYLWDMLDEGVIHLMQYTGMKDKNGVKVFEGDIIRMNDGHYDKWTIYEVTWDDEDHGWHPISGWYPASTLPMACEVIGNVHEHPELLKEKE